MYLTSNYSNFSKPWASRGNIFHKLASGFAIYKGERCAICSHQTKYM